MHVDIYICMYAYTHICHLQHVHHRGHLLDQREDVEAGEGVARGAREHRGDEEEEVDGGCVVGEDEVESVGWLGEEPQEPPPEA